MTLECEAKGTVAKCGQASQHVGGSFGARSTSVRTVANQVVSVFRKLCGCSRLELFAALASLGITTAALASVGPSRRAVGAERRMSVTAVTWTCAHNEYRSVACP